MKLEMVGGRGSERGAERGRERESEGRTQLISKHSSSRDQITTGKHAHNKERERERERA